MYVRHWSREDRNSRAPNLLIFARSVTFGPRVAVNSVNWGVAKEANVAGSFQPIYRLSLAFGTLLLPAAQAVGDGYSPVCSG